MLFFFFKRTRKINKWNESSKLRYYNFALYLRVFNEHLRFSTQLAFQYTNSDNNLEENGWKWIYKSW